MFLDSKILHHGCDCKEEKVNTLSSFHIHKRCQRCPTYSPLLHWSAQIANLEVHFMCQEVTLEYQTKESPKFKDSWWHTYRNSTSKLNHIDSDECKLV